MTEPTPTRLDSLQVLRFLAAFLVLVGHSQHELVAMLGARAGRYGFVPLDWGLGVDIFFVISGFVMFYLMHDRFGTPGASADFMRRRIIRIVPLYWLFTTLVLLLALRSGSAPGPLNILFSYLFMPGPACGEYCFPVFTLGWTLDYEMLFYVVFAIGLAWRRPIGLALVVAVIVALMVMGQVVPAGATMLHFWGYPIIGEFLIGIGLAWGFCRGWRLPHAAGWALVVLGLALAVLFYQVRAYGVIWRVVTGGVPASLIVAGAVLGLEPQRRARALALLVMGGDASYALYLSHPFAVKAVAGLGGARLAQAAPLLFLAVAAVIAVIAAWAVHRYVELPMLAAFKRRWHGKSRRVAPVRPAFSGSE